MSTFLRPSALLGNPPFQREIWTQRLILISVLLLSGGIAYRASPGQITLILVAVTGVIGVLVLLRWPPLGLMALIPVNMVVPLQLATGTASALSGTILLLIGLAILAIVDKVVLNPGIRLPSSRPILPCVLLMVAAVLAFLNGQLPWFVATPAPLQAQLGGLLVFLISPIGFLLAARQMGDLRWLQALTWLFVLLGALYMAGRVLPALYQFTRPLFLWGSTASQFWTWIAAIVFSQAWLRRDLSLPWRIALWALLAAIFYAAYETRDWASGWLPPLVAVMTIVAIRMPRLGALLVLVALLLVPRELSAFMAAEEYSYSTRLDAWLILLQIIAVNPILGLGPSNYYWFTSQYSIRGYYVTFNSHNQYVDIVAQTGIVGLVICVWFFWEVGRLGWRLRKRAPEGFARTYVYGALGGLAATIFSGFLGDWILPFVYNVGLIGLRSSILGWVFLGSLVALDRMTDDRVVLESRGVSASEFNEPLWRREVVVPTVD